MLAKKPNRNRTSRRKPLIGLVALIVVIMLVIVTLEATSKTHFFHNDPTAGPARGPTAAQKKQESTAAAAQKKQAAENPSAASSSPPPAANTPISMSAHQETNDTVTVFTNLSTISSGSCTLVVSNGSRVMTQTANVIYQPQYSTCAGFSVPVSNLGTGTWSLTLTVTSNGSSVSKTLNQDIN